MVWEIAELTIKPGQEASFEAAVARAKPLFERARGCSAMQVQRSIERPNVYRLIVEWATVEDHMVHFRGSPDFQEWRSLVGAYFESPPAVEHTERVL
jgi:heme-degrading monooxygenase HmoA